MNAIIYSMKNFLLNCFQIKMKHLNGLDHTQVSSPKMDLF